MTMLRGAAEMFALATFTTAIVLWATALIPH